PHGSDDPHLNSFNPLWAVLDHRRDKHSATHGRTTRVAIAGHSLGAAAVSYVQGVDKRVEAVVALDKLSATGSFAQDLKVKPVVPALAVQSEYGHNVQPYRTANGSPVPPQPGDPAKRPAPRPGEKPGFAARPKAHVVPMAV